MIPMKTILLCLGCLACTRPPSFVHLFDAIRAVESGGNPQPPDGDNGKAIGPYQIHYAYWKDATTFDKSIGGTYPNCSEKVYAEKIMWAYWQRYCPKELRIRDLEVLARVHNGGPKGKTKRATDNYWKKVKGQLEKQKK